MLVRSSVRAVDRGACSRSRRSRSRRSKVEPRSRASRCVVALVGVAAFARRAVARRRPRADARSAATPSRRAPSPPLPRRRGSDVSASASCSRPARSSRSADPRFCSPSCTSRPTDGGCCPSTSPPARCSAGSGAVDRIVDRAGGHARDRQPPGVAVTNRRVLATGVRSSSCTSAVLAVTVLARDAHVRPLYDGIRATELVQLGRSAGVLRVGQHEAGGRSPRSSTLGSGGLERRRRRDARRPARRSTSRAARSLGTVGSDREVRVEITPVDPKQLAKVPLGLRANGNAYRVDDDLRAVGAPGRPVRSPGTVLIEIPEVGDRLFRSANGQQRGPRWLRTRCRRPS